VDLHRRLWAGRPGERLGAAPRLARHLDAPAPEVVGELELDRRVLDPEHVLDQLGKAGRPATGVTAEDRLDRISLRIVGSVMCQARIPSH
jgi:hypothetical protein